MSRRSFKLPRHGLLPQYGVSQFLDLDAEVDRDELEEESGDEEVYDQG
jgi:hypothetical protein